MSTQDSQEKQNANGWGWVNGVEGDDVRIEAIEARTRPEYVIDASTCKLDDIAQRAAVNRENAAGGEARGIVLRAGQLLGIDLTDKPVDGQTWSPANMQRVLQAIENLQYRSARAHGGGVDSLAHVAFAEAAYRGKTRRW